MSRVFSRVLHFIKKRKVLLAIVASLVVIIVTVASVSGNGKLETTTLKTEDLVRTVKISGKVVPRERVDLGFEVSGTVASVNKPVGAKVAKGETLARLDSGATAANLQKAEAELASALAELNKLEGAEAYENSVVNAKRSLTQAIVNAYTAALDAVENKADQIFYDPRGVSPNIIGSMSGLSDVRDSVQRERTEMVYTLQSWHEVVKGLTSTSLYSQTRLDLSKKYLDQVTAFIADVLRVVNAFQVTSNMSQTTIDGYKDVILSGRDSLSTATKNLIDGENSLAKLLADIPVQVAKVEGARASVLNYQFELAKTALLSPISGVVAKQEAKVGQSATAGTSLVSVISAENIIEAYVPEVSIVGIKLGDTAKVTLEAYGTRTIFDTKVEQIDPAETIRDGVSTYKIKLAFVTADERIRSGMTANIEIETFRKPSVSLIPDRTVVREGGEEFVYVLVNGKRERRVLELGERDSRGNVEVLSGLSALDSVVVNP